MDQTIRLDAKKREGSFCEERIYPLRRGERNNVVLTVQVRADGAHYDQTMTIESAYAYLKTLPEFEGAADVPEGGGADQGVSEQ